VCEALRDDNRRLEEETSRWQERLKTQEETQNQLKILKQKLEELQSARAQEKKEDRPSGGQFGAADESKSVPSPLASDHETIIQSGVDSVESPSVSVSSQDRPGHPQQDISTSPTLANEMRDEQKTTQLKSTLAHRNWRRGMIAGSIVFLFLAGATVSRFLGDTKPALAPATDADEYTPETVVKAQGKPAPRVRGTFQTIRATQIYSGRSEKSALIANIERGMKLNVVDSRDGWLEIRSKHGRPPGFIREDAAVKIGND